MSSVNVHIPDKIVSEGPGCASQMMDLLVDDMRAVIRRRYTWSETAVH